MTQFDGRKATRFHSHSSDGMDEEAWCVDGRHLRVCKDDDGNAIVLGESQQCDGTCRTDGAALDVRAHAEAMKTERPWLRIRVEPSARSIVAAGMTRGICFFDWYVKRNSRGERWCADGQHVTFSMACDPGVSNSYRTVIVAAIPCDGTCRPVEFTLDEQADRAVRGE